jgi:hypothetical protein
VTTTSCPYCKYYTPNLRDTNKTGICRRHPPVGFPAGGSAVITAWPIVLQADWCGDGEAGVSKDSLLAAAENGKKN